MPVPDLIQLLEQRSPLFHSPIHGIGHWRRVERNGLHLCRFCDADPRVVSCFAYLHDSMRENENHDPLHGRRGGDFALEHRHLLGLDEEQLRLLRRACLGHTFARRANHPTLAVCWDADRLDLGRVGIDPDPRYLFTPEARRIARECDFATLDP